MGDILYGCCGKNKDEDESLLRQSNMEQTLQTNQTSQDTVTFQPLSKGDRSNHVIGIGSAKYANDNIDFTINSGIVQLPIPITNYDALFERQQREWNAYVNR